MSYWRLDVGPVVFLHANHGSEEDVLWFASALALLALCGASLARTSRRTNAAANQTAWIASAGLVAVLAATSPPFDSLADHSFSIHMVQHMLLVLFAALTFVVYRWIRLDELSFERQRLSRTGQVR